MTRWGLCPLFICSFLSLSLQKYQEGYGSEQKIFNSFNRDRYQGQVHEQHGQPQQLHQGYYPHYPPQGALPPQYFQQPNTYLVQQHVIPFYQVQQVPVYQPTIHQTTLKPTVKPTVKPTIKSTVKPTTNKPV